MKRRTILRLFLLILVLGFIIYLLRIRSDLKKNTDFHKADDLNWVSTNEGYIHIKTFKSKNLQDSTNLVLIIHGDSPFEKPGYQYQMAHIIADQNNNTISIAILRPGYTDSEDKTSNGVRGLTTGDNYNPEVIKAISETISELKKIYRPRRTIVIGHSGGAAITADLIGLDPGLINVAVLVSCPCNIAKWRQHMFGKQFWNPLWLLNVTSISPSDVLEKIDANTSVIIIAGTNDDITPLNMIEEYYERLKSLNKKVQLYKIPGQGHDILLNENVVAQIDDLIKDTGR